MSSRRCFAGSGGLSCVYPPRAQTHERSVAWQQTDSTLGDNQRLHCQQNKQKTWEPHPARENRRCHHRKQPSGATPAAHLSQ